MCHLGNRLHTIEITFFRFFFSFIMLIPFIFFQKKGILSLKTKAYGHHIARITLGAIALWLGCISVNHISLSQNTAITFTQPLFFLPLAYVFLKEKIGFNRIFATIIGFMGLLYLVQPWANHFSLWHLIPMLAAFLFAILDVITKKMVTNESTLTLLFYFSLGSTLLTFPFIISTCSPLTFYEVFLLFVLGLGGNMIQICLFLAFSATQASALAPFRYVELVIAILFGYLFFNQLPTIYTFIGSSIIIFSTLYLLYMETKSSERQKINSDR